MSTISEKLTRLAGYKDDIKQSILDKGGTVGDDMSEFSQAINDIPSGGGGEDVFAGLIDGSIEGRVVIPSGKTKIRDYGLAYCDKMTSVSIPNTVTTIGSSAFCCCNALTGINLPNSITSLGNDCFGECYVLTSADLSKTKITTIPGSCFEYCYKLADIKFPNTVAVLSQNAFGYCTGLTKMDIPDSVTTIKCNNYSFGNYGPWVGCTNLKELNFGNTRTTVPSLSGWDAFSKNVTPVIVVPTALYSQWKTATNWCTVNDYVDIPSLITPYAKVYGADNNQIVYLSTEQAVPHGTFNANIASHTFSDGVGVITFDDTLTTIPDYAFDGRDRWDNGSTTQNANINISFIAYPSTVTSVGRYAFADRVATVKEEYNGSSALGEYMFMQANVENIVVKEGATSIPKGCFWDTVGTNATKSISLPSTLTTIGEYGLSSFCESGMIFRVPDAVTSIGYRGLNIYENLDGSKNYIDFGGTRTTIPTLASGDATNFNSLTYIIVPDNMIDSWKAADEWSKYADKMMGSRDYPRLSLSIKQIRYQTISGDRSYFYTNHRQYRGWQADDGKYDSYTDTWITTVNDTADLTGSPNTSVYMCNDSTLKKVWLPEGMENLYATFMNAYNLEYVRIPDSVEYMRSSFMFSNCSKAVVDFGNTRTTVPYMDDWVDTIHPKKYIIPDALYDDFMDTTVFKAIVSEGQGDRIVKYSDYYAD